MSELIQPYRQAAVEPIFERARLQNLIKTVYSVVTEFTEVDRYMSVPLASASGCFTEAYLQAYADFESGQSGKTGVGSPGFGYSDETVKAMLKEGFYWGPSVALYYKNFGPVWNTPDGDGQEVSQHIGQRQKDIFESYGLKCFWAVGGSFPNEMTDTAIVLDISDPEFLQKLKPLFLKVFAQQKVSSIVAGMTHPNVGAGNEECYVHEMLKAMRRVLNEGGCSDGRELQEQGIHFSDEQVVRAQGQVEYQMKFVEPPLRVMREVMSNEEKEALIL